MKDFEATSAATEGSRRFVAILEPVVGDLYLSIRGDDTKNGMMSIDPTDALRLRDWLTESLGDASDLEKKRTIGANIIAVVQGLEKRIAELEEKPCWRRSHGDAQRYGLDRKRKEVADGNG